MPRLDAFIELMFREGAESLVMETGAAANLVTGGQLRPAMQRALTTQQIVSAIAELVPAYQRQFFSAAEALDFEYQLPAGRVKIAFEPLEEGVRATVSKAAPREEGAPQKAPRGVPIIPPPPPAQAAPQQPAREGHGIEVGPPPADASIAMHQLLDLTVHRKASDLHLSTGFTPALRLDGEIVPLVGYGNVTHERLEALLFTLAPAKNREQWEATKDTDFAYETPLARFRVNVYADRMGIAAVLRRIPAQVMSAEEMGLSTHILNLCTLHKGLVLVTGPTGSGKSTTLAAMIDYINRNRDDHILTIEDPIEFVHPHKRCLVHQREVGVHTAGFKQALRAALREDPDVVLVGELRDLETIAIALETAETGHLVFGTLHTNTAPSTVDRIIDQFPADRQSQIRTMLSESLKGVIAQTLVKKIGGGRAAAQEVLLVNSAISNLIREGKTFQIPSIMQTQRGNGMTTLNDSLFELIKKKLVSPEDALAKAVQRVELKAMIDRLQSGQTGAGTAQ